MPHPTSKRVVALITSASILAASTVATAAIPASAGTPKCMGNPATIVGTMKGEIIRGTAGADVIVARGGHDRIYGRGGNDVICGKGGNDQIFGGSGIDSVLGGTGRDLMNGGTEDDTLRGGPGNDRFVGGIGFDTCYQGSGRGLVRTCELGSIPWLAIAYGDLTGDHAPNEGDALISKVIDANGDGGVSKGDTIVMGKYPTTPSPTSTAHFTPWGVGWHVVDSVVSKEANALTVKSADGGTFDYHRLSPTSVDQFQEQRATSSSVIDAKGGDNDSIAMKPSSPSKPKNVKPAEKAGTGDDRLIDVELAW